MKQGLHDSIEFVDEDRVGLFPERSTWYHLAFEMMLRLGISRRDLNSRIEGSLCAFESLDCLTDQIRTKRFLEALEAALDASDQSKIIRVVDAGAGAFPVLSIYAAVYSPRVRVTALELNPHSCLIAKRVVDYLNLRDQINVVCADAISYKAPLPIDILVSETMFSGLTHEPIVAILKNLVSQMNSNGIVIPQEVTVKAALIPVTAYPGERRVDFGGVATPYFDVQWPSSFSYTAGQDLKEIHLSLSVDRLTVGETYFLFLSSDVSLGAKKLGDYESLITTPRMVLEEAQDEDPLPWLFTPSQADIASHKKIHLRYKPGGSVEGIASFE